MDETATAPDATVGVDPQQVVEQLRGRLQAAPRHIRPLEHAAVRYALGMAYAELPTGDRRLNLSRAIAHYEDAARLFSPDRYPVEHARVQNARGAALRELGEFPPARAALETALGILRGVDDRARVATEYGAALNNLGLVRGAEGDHEAAIAILQDAVAVFARPEDVRQRVMARYNLGQTQAAAGDHAGAVSTYQTAVDDADHEGLPYQWALVHHGLGVSLTALDEPARAAAAFSAALQVFTRQRYPFQHALAKNNLGLASAQVGDVPALRRAVASFEDALAILDPRLHRELWQQTFHNLELAERALEERGAGGTRVEHLARLLADLPDEQRLAILRDRLMRYLELPEPHRTESLGELDLAVLRLPDDGPRRVTAAWLNILMELPNEQLVAGLQARIAAMAHLDEEPEQDEAGEMLEVVIREELLAPQRIRVRDTLEFLGYDRRY